MERKARICTEDEKLNAGEIKSLLAQYVTMEVDLRRRVAMKMMIISVVLYALGVFFISSPFWGSLFAVIGALFLALFVNTGFKWQDEASRDAEERFWAKYPQYLEVIKRAE